MTKFSKIFVPLMAWVGGALIIILPFLYLSSEKKISSERKYWNNVGTFIQKESNKGSDTDLAKSFLNMKMAIEKNYCIINDKYSTEENKKIAELSSLDLKIGMMTLLMDIDPKQANFDWRVLEIHEIAQFTDNLTQLYNQYRIKLRYESGAPISTMPLELFFELGVTPPENFVEYITVKNISANKIYMQDEIQIKKIGSTNSFSPVCQVTIPVKMTELRNNKTIELSVLFKPVKQNYPYSLYSQHLHRFRRGVDKVEVTLLFDSPVNLLYYTFDEDTRKATQITSKVDNYIVLDEERRPNGKIMKYQFKVEEPKTPIALAFLMHYTN